MKLKIFIIGALIITAFSTPVKASVEPITGTAYGEEIGLIHFDYKTAIKPSLNPIFNSLSYYLDSTKQFYISPFDPYFKQNYIPGSPNTTVQISNDKRDCNSDGCLIKGLAWSDKIGWILFDGKIINQAISKINNIDENEENTANDPYPEKYFPRIKTKNTPSGRLALTGRAWNKEIGWILLSSDDAGKNGVITDANLQKKDEWGAWLDSQSKIETIDVKTGSSTITQKKGRKLRGNIWSEKLGWIKLSKEPSDQTGFDFSTYTLWSPDHTPPVVLAPNNSWYAIGTNSGFPSETSVPTHVVLPHFAIDPESGIDEKKSQFFIQPENSFLGCITPPAFEKGKITSVAISLKPIPNNYPVLGTGSLMNVVIPTIGNLKSAQKGYCKYELHAEIWNNNHQVSYIGDHFIPDLNTPYTSKKSIFVRAGDPAQSTSSVKPQSKKVAVADGKDLLSYQVELNDIAGNPVVPVNCKNEYVNCPGRNVELKVKIKNPKKYQSTQNHPVSPVYYHSLLSTINLVADSNTDVNYLGNSEWNLPVSLKPNSLDHVIEFSSYSPSESYDSFSGLMVDRRIEIKELSYQIKNDALPATSRLLTQSNPVVIETYQKKDKNNPISGIKECIEPSTEQNTACLNPNFSTNPQQTEYRVVDTNKGAFEIQNQFASFISPFQLKNAEITSVDSNTTLSISQPAQVSYEIENISNRSFKPVLGTGISIDHLFQFTSSNTQNPLLALMKVERIRNTSPDDATPNTLGWQNPFEPFNYNARYELFMKEGWLSNTPATPLLSSNTPFHNSFEIFHSSEKFWFDHQTPFRNIPKEYQQKYTSEIKNEINNDGTYSITGRESIPQIYQPIDNKVDLNDPFNYPPGKIDRNESSYFSFDKKGDTLKKGIEFYIEKLTSLPITGISLQVVQPIAYRYPEQPFTTFYEIQHPNLKSSTIQDLKLEAKGFFSGKSLVNDRQFKPLGEFAYFELQKDIRKNVAQLTNGINKELCKLRTPSKTLSQLEIQGGCTFKNPENESIVAYYEGDSNQNLILGSGNDIIAPDTPYTLILKGGLNLTIAENLIGKKPIGIILISNNQANESNVYLRPKPTNIQATLYTEGSLLSQSESGQLYYGGGTGNLKDLKNQLFWQGSIASKNTVGGYSTSTMPAEAKCLEENNETKRSCAQRYDLDFLRRFTVSQDPISKKEIPLNSGLFSGGGQCINGVCNYGKWPTTIKLELNEIQSANSEISPVYIEPLPENQNQPPPGFKIENQLNTQQKIR